MSNVFVKQTGRQPVASAVIKIDWADFVDEQVRVIASTPQGAILTGGFLIVDQVFDVGITATVTVGTDTVSSAVALGTVASTDITVPVVVNRVPVDVTVTLSAASVKGEAFLVLNYVQLDKSVWPEG